MPQPSPQQAKALRSPMAPRVGPLLRLSKWRKSTASLKSPLNKTLGQRQLVFDVHDKAIQFYGVVRWRGIYGNMKTAVEAIFVGKAREYRGIFKRDSKHLRSLLVHGASAVVRTATNKNDPFEDCRYLRTAMPSAGLLSRST